MSRKSFPGPAKEHPPATKPLPPLDTVSLWETVLDNELISSALLVLSAVLALVIANSPFGHSYHFHLDMNLGIALGNHHFDKTLHHWINDGLMSIFFFWVGLEIKREILVGELSSIRKAMLPVAAAFGGMAVPAIFYFFINKNTPGQHGWGVPMATDIAFVAGCIAILRKRIPSSLLIFVVALAIVDDMGAVTVIALFYTEKITLTPLLIGTVLILLSFILGFLKVRVTTPYAVIGVIIWAAFLQSGVHATIAGVLLAFSIPVTARYQTRHFPIRVSELIKRFLAAESLWEKDDQGMYLNLKKDVMINDRQQELVDDINWECHHVASPLQRIERGLSPLCMFVILPLFAFVNAGMHFDFSHGLNQLFHPVTLGVVAGLVLGKPAGILLGSFLSVKIGLAELPRRVRWRHIAGVGCLAGIGFTMSLFINELAFKDMGARADALIAAGKIGVFAASILAAVIGLIVLRLTSRP